MLQCLAMEELNQTYYSAFCEIGWRWIFPVQDKPFQDHKQHYVSALDWCKDRNISIVEGRADLRLRHTVYVMYHIIRFTSREDCLAFTLAYGDLYISTPKEE
jgi:hypothetical protein